MSALNADATRGGSAYLRSKGAGEDLAHRADGLQVSSLRPSVIFGRGDSFFNRFASLLEMSPGIFPLACPDARFAPVWVGDVCEAIARMLDDPRTVGGRYDLCGPRVFSLEELVTKTAEWIGRRRLLLGLNDRASQWQAKLFERLPGQPFTMDNYRSLQTPSVCGEHNGLLELGIHPRDIDSVVPTYLR
jgi:NADH dehydrogenase